MAFSFESFVNSQFDCDKIKVFRLREENADIDGGKITFADIDRLKDHPDVEVVTVSGLRQDTFEYFIKSYGKQLKAIRFFKNKFVEDLSLLGTLPKLEYVSFYANQKVTELWNMTENRSLIGLCIEDFLKLTSIKEIETAPALKEFKIGNAIFGKMVVDSLMPLANTKIERLSFTGKAIADNDLSFLENMPNLKMFEFATNLFTTEQVAWITANFPQIEGDSLRAKIDYVDYYNEEWGRISETIIVGKGKPILKSNGNEKKIQKYVDSFEKMKEKYRGMPYHVAFLPTRPQI